MKYKIENATMSTRSGFHHGILVTSDFELEFYPTNTLAPEDPNELLQKCADMLLHKNGAIESMLSWDKGCIVNSDWFDAEQIKPFFTL